MRGTHDSGEPLIQLPRWNSGGVVRGNSACLLFITDLKKCKHNFKESIKERGGVYASSSRGTVFAYWVPGWVSDLDMRLGGCDYRVQVAAELDRHSHTSTLTGDPGDHSLYRLPVGSIELVGDVALVYVTTPVKDPGEAGCPG